MPNTFRVQLRSIDSIKPYDRNPRINDKAVDAVAASLREFGFRQPIVVDADGVIVAGHTRWKAAKQLGLAKAPVHVATDLTPEQIRAYRIADNKTGERATWDFEILPIELDELRKGGFDLEVLAFDEEELAKLLDEAAGLKQGLTDPEEVPEPPDEAITQRGDLYVLGDHRLLCGDSSDEKDVDRLVEGQSIDLVNMDPPYNVRVEPRSNNAVAAGLSSFGDANKKAQMHHQAMDEAIHGHRKPTHKKLRAKDRPLENDFLSDEAFAEMLLAWFGNAARVLKLGGSFFIWGGYGNIGNYPPALKACGLYFSQGIVWDKEHPVLTRKDFLGGFELCFYGWHEGAGHHFYGPNNVVDIWHVKKINPQSMIHLTEKPVELAVRAIQCSSKQGENVLDLFAGSGSTLIGCEQTGRRAFLMEIDELYCDVIVKRWEEFTGKKAKRQSRKNA
ncbi:MAG: ParB N-terminal domain-containing protein [Planctomycetes bacterium]|nr:ParB N-terminal domain-containing protein [Planctomycetota bacterium]